jgi:hypothetical protein
LGRWRLVKSEGDFYVGEGVTMTFTEDGKLVYVIRQKGSKQIMNLVYRVDGSRLITDQPSSPKEESTEFSFDSKGDLLLKYAGGKAWFTRA